MEAVERIQEILANATGTTQYYEHPESPGYPLMTNNVHDLARAARCFWLLDVILSHQENKSLEKDFQAWKLEVNGDKSATVRGYNDMNEIVVEQHFESIDFPLDEITIWFCEGILLLPSEY